MKHSCFPVNFAKFLRTTVFTEHLRTTASIETDIGKSIKFYKVTVLYRIFVLAQNGISSHVKHLVWWPHQTKYITTVTYWKYSFSNPEAVILCMKLSKFWK